MKDLLVNMLLNLGLKEDKPKVGVDLDPIEVILREELEELRRVGNEPLKTDPELALSTGYWVRRK